MNDLMVYDTIRCSDDKDLHTTIEALDWAGYNYEVDGLVITILEGELYGEDKSEDFLRLGGDSND